MVHQLCLLAGREQRSSEACSGQKQGLCSDWHLLERERHAGTDRLQVDGHLDGGGVECLRLPRAEERRVVELRWLETRALVAALEAPIATVRRVSLMAAAGLTFVARRASLGRSRARVRRIALAVVADPNPCASLAARGVRCRRRDATPVILMPVRHEAGSRGGQAPPEQYFCVVVQRIRLHLSQAGQRHVSSGLVIHGRSKRSGAVSLACLLYTSPSPRDRQKSRMPSSA